MPSKKNARAPGNPFKDTRIFMTKFYLWRQLWNLTVYDGPWDELSFVFCYLQEHIACQPKTINRNFVNSYIYHIGDVIVTILNPCKLENLRIQCWTFAKKTILHTWHTAHHANLAPFSGYDMPLWYASAKNEHLAVLNSAGLFDTSHMAVI